MTVEDDTIDIDKRCRCGKEASCWREMPAMSDGTKWSLVCCEDCQKLPQKKFDSMYDDFLKNTSRCDDDD